MARRIKRNLRIRGVLSEFAAWQNMKVRCLDPDFKQAKNYILRGITVCEEWLNDFEQFLADMGPRPKGDGTRAGEYSLDRIENNGNYEPSNCKWSTRYEQSNNTSRSRLFTYRGVTASLHFWARSCDINPTLLSSRIYGLGYTLEQAITIPIRTRGRPRA